MTAERPIPLQPIDRTGLQERFDEWIGFIARAHGGTNPRVNEVVPFSPLEKPLADSRVALLTTAGAHLEDQEPFHTETRAGDHSHRILPDDLDPARLRFAHTHYDTASADADPNCVFPIDRLHELVDQGRLGATSDIHIGMMGFNPDPTPVAEILAPTVAALLRDHEVDIALLVPG